MAKPKLFDSFQSFFTEYWNFCLNFFNFNIFLYFYIIFICKFSVLNIWGYQVDSHFQLYCHTKLTESVELRIYIVFQYIHALWFIGVVRKNNLWAHIQPMNVIVNCVVTTFNHLLQRQMKVGECRLFAVHITLRRDRICMFIDVYEIGRRRNVLRRNVFSLSPSWCKSRNI